jgi:hypothetical protein
MWAVTTRAIADLVVMSMTLPKVKSFGSCFRCAPAGVGSVTRPLLPGHALNKLCECAVVRLLLLKLIGLMPKRRGWCPVNKLCRDHLCQTSVYPLKQGEIGVVDLIKSVSHFTASALSAG